jgi:ech hydrogenase subunit B
MGQDMLLILFAHAFSTLALILGGMSVRSPYSRIGSMRKIMQMLAYEPILVMMVVGMYLTTGRPGEQTFMASAVVAGKAPLLQSLPLLFVTFIVAMAIKLQKSPFDVATSHHAHQELVKGITIEYSGPFLGIIELTHFYEVFVLFGILAAFWASNLLIGLGLSALGFFVLVLLDNLCARLSTMWMVRFMWTVPLLLALSNIVWLYIRPQ